MALLCRINFRSAIFPAIKTNLINPRCSYAKKVGIAAAATLKGGKIAGMSIEKRRMEVETDPEKLVKYCCGVDYTKEGQPIELKPDGEYPEWLWRLRLGEELMPSQMDPNTIEYWVRLHRLCNKRKLKLMRHKQLDKMRVNEKDKIEKLKALRFRALASRHYDAGIKIDQPLHALFYKI